MERRNIEREMVDAVMENPEQKVLEIDNIICYQSKVKFENKTYLLRIIVNEDLDTPVVLQSIERVRLINTGWIYENSI